MPELCAAPDGHSSAAAMRRSRSRWRRCYLGGSCTKYEPWFAAFGPLIVGLSAYTAEVFVVIDPIDRDILRHLRRDGRATQRELGAAVGLSPNAAAARMARLVSSGIITGFHAAIDAAALGRPLAAWVDVWLEQMNDDDAFLEIIANDERIAQAIEVTGPVDYRLRVAVESPEDLESLLRKLRQDGGVRQTDSRLVLRDLTAERTAE